MVSTEPGPRLGRERLRNGGIQCEPVRDENPCAAWISTVSSTWHEPLILTTDQEVGDSSSSGRAAETPVLRGFRRVKFATVEDMGHVFWVVSWSARHRDRCVRAVRDEASRTETIRVHRENFSVHGVLKTWAHLNGEGIAVARCTVEWLIPVSYTHLTLPTILRV